MHDTSSNFARDILLQYGVAIIGIWLWHLRLAHQSYHALSEPRGLLSPRCLTNMQFVFTKQRQELGLGRAEMSAERREPMEGPKADFLPDFRGFLDGTIATTPAPAERHLPALHAIEALGGKSMVTRVKRAINPRLIERGPITLYQMIKYHHQ